MSNPKIKTTPAKNPCGFCMWGLRHDLCPSGVLNGSGVEILRCQCGCERSQEFKCLDCGTRLQDEIDPDTWRCFDDSGCSSRKEARLANDPVLKQIREIKEASAKRTAEERQLERQRRIERGEEVPVERVKGAPRATVGQCLHCGEPTKGGKFLPGHDAAYLSNIASSIAAGEHSLDEWIEKMTEYGCSEALVGKLRKRVVVAA